MDWRCVLSFYIIFITIKRYSSAVCSKTTSFDDGKNYYIKYYCCENSFEENGQCKDCQTGFYSEPGIFEKCTPCSSNSYGYNCLDKCSCKESERCDNVVGCMPFSPKPLTAEEKGSDSTNTVVAYMSTVASIGGVVVIVIAVWRHKEFISKKIRKQKNKFARLQKTTSLVFENEKKVEQKVRKSENPYDDIDEKDMVKDLKDITY